MTVSLSLPAPFPPSLTEALTARGYTDLTTIQRAVIEPGLRNHDLRLTSQTGSGKTVALGLALAADLITSDPFDDAPARAAQPRALIVAPTRELATQLRDELSWLYAPLGWRVAVVTGGTSLSGDRQLLRRNPPILVGTPGRLTDHLRQNNLDLSNITAVALDEADEMLDMGFRDDLESILKAAPATRRTHMVSATFAPDVLALADRYQRGARAVQGTQTTRANADIRHVILPVRAMDRLAALTNLTLLAPNDRTLVFVRTRAEAEDVSRALSAKGFHARYLSGDLSQRDRHATLDAFRDGQTTTLIATDVAARGLDIQGVTRVIHWDLPGSPDSFTHRSGRTGRAGRAGTSFLFTPPEANAKAQRLLRALGVNGDIELTPTPAQVRAAQSVRLLEEINSATPADLDPHRAFADTLLTDRDPADVVAWLLSQHPIGACPPYDLAPVTIRDPRKPALRSSAPPMRSERPVRAPAPRPERPVRSATPLRADAPILRADPPIQSPAPSAADPVERAPVERAPVEKAPVEKAPAKPKKAATAHDASGYMPMADAPSDAPAKPKKAKKAEKTEKAEPREPLVIDRGAPNGRAPAWIPFQVSWGTRDGADPRRLLAILCRRGDITGDDVGAIEIGERSTRVDIALHAATQFADASQKPDPRNPQIMIRPWLEDAKRVVKAAKKASRPSTPPTT
jgi:ATP-dependent RNA helicase DeaD